MIRNVFRWAGIGLLALVIWKLADGDLAGFFINVWNNAIYPFFDTVSSQVINLLPDWLQN